MNPSHISGLRTGAFQQTQALPLDTISEVHSQLGAKKWPRWQTPVHPRSSGLVETLTSGVT